MILAAALYTIRREVPSPAAFAGGLQRLRDIGYRGVEAGGVPLLEGPDPAISARDLKRMLDDAGLQCVGAHARWREIRDDTSAVIDRLQELDCPIISVPAFIDEFDRFEPASYATFAGEAALVTQVLGEHGMRLGYHHHAHEFLRFGADRRTMFDVLIDEPSLAIEIDVYWAAFGGVDPAGLIERLPGRVPLLHCKDLEMIRDAEAGARPFFAPVGEGNLNWDRILAASQAAGTEAWVVEQDQCLRDPFDCLRSSFEFLQARVPSSHA
ncbi:MAG: sugar phosphate isomerase/epimerase [Chloroflexota bacterium]|nr:sugar phosphate isomerase/epimerase [Chloroflexota bacterium]